MRNDSKSSKSGQRPRKPGGFNPNKTQSNESGDKRYNFRDNPKTYSRPETKPSSFGGSQTPPKRHVSKFDPNDRYGSKKPDSDQSNDRFESRKPNFDRNDRPSFSDRPKRNFDSDRPKFDGNKPRFEGSKPRFDSDKPRFERPEKREFGSRNSNFDKDRPRFNDEKPKFENREKRNFEDRPAKKYDGDKPLRRYKAEGNTKFEEVTEKAPGKFDNDKSRFSAAPGRAPQSFGEAPRNPRGPKRFEGPYQKNLNQDTGGGTRSSNKDSYRSDGTHFDYESRLKETNEEKNGTIRLNRYIANSGICSRRDADELIIAGQITVNGEVVKEMGQQVSATDVVKYGNKLLSREKMIYLLLNKPKDYITTTEDPQERKTVMKLIEGACKERIYPVGRLDRNTTGLILFTNDGELASKLTHPSYNVEKMYQVELDKPITEEAYQAVLKGVTLEDGEIKADSFGIVTPDAMVVGIQIHSGRNHIVRRIFAHLGYEVVKLDRTVFAGLNKKDLPRGNYRMLNQKEIIKLKYLSS